MPYDYDYFISYAHKDNQSEDGKPGFVEEFVDKLQSSPEHQQMFGERVKVFFDKSEIHSMLDWDNRIRSSLASSRFFVALLSPNYFKSEYCAREFDWWMQHEMHRRVLGEGTAPMLIVTVDDLYNFSVNPLPAIPQDILVKFPNWVKQIRQIQSGPDFDMHDLERAKIDEILRSLCENTKDKYFKQVIAEKSPINAAYPKYNENFVGRRENLRSLRQTLSTSCTTAISAVNGLGGIGKTELALTYGHAFAWDYELGRVFATCENSDSLEDVILSSSIAEMHGLKLEGTNEKQLTTLYNALKQKIKLIEQRNIEKDIDRTLGTHVLLILDNVNRLELISQRNLDKLPDFFHVIITTREDANKFPHIHTESVERLSEDESVELLSNLREFGDDPQEAVAAREIAKLLDGFTLAVELTGSYLKKSPRVTYQKQFERLNANISDAMETMADKTQSLRRHQAECISVVLESSLSALSDNARKALEFAALMSPDAVGFSWLPELLGLDEDEGWEVLDELTGYSLLTPLGGEPNIARIHRLVAEAVKKDIPEDIQKKIIAKIREKCEALLEKEETFWCSPENSWNITSVFEFCMAIAEQWKVEAAEREIDWSLTTMLLKSGETLKILGNMKEASRVFQRIINISVKRDKVFPSNYRVQAFLSYSYFRIGYLENAAGNTITARNWYEKSLGILYKQAKKSPEDFGILLALDNMYINFGSLEETNGNTVAAREWYEKDLKIFQQLVKKIPENDLVQLNLSVLYGRLGNLEKSIGNTATSREWYEKALKIKQKLAAKKPEDVSVMKQLAVSYEQLGILEKDAGNTAIAREWYEKTLEIDITLVDKMPENVQIQHGLFASYQRLGDLEKAAGNTDHARTCYEKAMNVAHQLADKMPEDIHSQRLLSVIYERFGDLEKATGNITAAKNWCEKTLEIDKQLADKMPESVQIQQGLMASYQHLGQFEMAAGNADNARAWFEKDLEIAHQLLDKMPDDVQVQRSLGISYNLHGDLENAAGNATVAREWYKKAMEIFKLLTDLMPENVDAQQNLSASYDKLGNLENDAGNVAAAREWYKKEQEISKRLADFAPDNVQAQRNLSVSYCKLGNLEEAAGNIEATREMYEKALEIFKQLAEKTPDNVDIQRVISILYSKLGDLERKAGNAVVAREWFEKALEIHKRLAEKMPDNIQVQRDLGYLYVNFGIMEVDAGNTTAVREWWEKSLQIFKRLADLMPDNVQAQEDLAMIQKALAQVQNQP